MIVVAKTNPALGAKGISLLLVERGLKGFERGQRLKKMGLKAQDTSELFFDDVRVPASNLLGDEGKGFVYLMQELPWERMQIAIRAAASARGGLDWTIDYMREPQGLRQGGDRLPEHALQAGRAARRRCRWRASSSTAASTLRARAASSTPPPRRWSSCWTTEMQGKVLDECLQLHGGYGFMWEYPITRAYADARVQRIYGGTNEIMKELIARSMGLGK